MTRSLVLAAALSLVASASWAQVQNAGPQGSTGGNSVGAALSAPAPSAPAANADVPSGVQVQNGGPSGSTGSNNVGATVAAPASPPPATATGGAQSHRTQ